MHCITIPYYTLRIQGPMSHSLSYQSSTKALAQNRSAHTFFGVVVYNVICAPMWWDTEVPRCPPLVKVKHDIFGSIFSCMGKNQSV